MTVIYFRNATLRLLCAGLAVLTGCTTSTVEKRKQERYGAYSALAPEMRSRVDAGQVKVGMTEDAVYIALGKPDQILQEETQAGATTRWHYLGAHLEEYRYSNYGEGEVDYVNGPDSGRFDLDTDRHQVVVGFGLRF